MPEFYVIEVNKNRKYRYADATLTGVYGKASLEELESHEIRIVEAANEDLARMRFEDGVHPKSKNEIIGETIEELSIAIKKLSSTILSKHIELKPYVRQIEKAHSKLIDLGVIKR